jgi:hypothetical protein
MKTQVDKFFRKKLEIQPRGRYGLIRFRIIDPTRCGWEIVQNVSPQPSNPAPISKAVPISSPASPSFLLRDSRTVAHPPLASAIEILQDNCNLERRNRSPLVLIRRLLLIPVGLMYHLGSFQGC